MENQYIEDNDTKLVTIVMPIYNEERYIEECINTLLKQDYPQKDMEWIFVDGLSTDRTKTIIQTYIEKYTDLIQLIDNPNITVPFAMNIGIKAARGRYIIRLDAHCEFANDYISKCVFYLENTDADNVGGIAITKSKSFLGEVLADMISTPFGVGNSTFRIGGKDGYVDTVPFGAFRKEVFSKYGYYDERLTRNQDNELNYRIRKNGGKIYFSNDIKFIYYSRDSLKAMNRMARLNGQWNVITMYLCPGSMGIRHFIPLLFVLSIIMGAISVAINWMSLLSLFFYAEMISYLLLDILFSFKVAIKNKLIYFPLLLLFYPSFHISYGIGSIGGLYQLLRRDYRGAI